MTQNWLWMNREWLFSGIGVVILVTLVTVATKWLRKKPEPSSLSPVEDAFLTRDVGVQSPPHRVWTVLNAIPGFRGWAQMHIFTDAEVDRRIRVGVCGNDQGISFWRNGQQGRTAVYLDVVNFNPFPLRIDRITGDVTVNGSPVAQVKHVDPADIPPSAAALVHFEIELGPAQVENILFQLNNRADASAGLSINMYVESKARKVTLKRQFTTGNRRFYNFVVYPVQGSRPAAPATS